jgi:hypothetical protein
MIVTQSLPLSQVYLPLRRAVHEVKPSLLPACGFAA